TLCLIETPALYKTVFKKVPVPGTGDGKGGPATKVIDIPAEYESVSREVVVEPARVERNVVPAEYDNVKKKVMVEPARTERVVIPAEYDMVRKKIMVEAAQTNTVSVPAEYKTVRVKRVTQEASERRVPVAAEYENITKKVKVSDSKIVWRAVLCEDQVQDSKIITVQKYLIQEGFNPGQVDGSLNTQTQQALRDFQRAKGLPEGGGLTIETLEALGIY
ncbi:MAG: peptidoglycan-binding protein, partial [Candidatus Electrothrix sp. AR3]|nr:peptidoglycan-binding protein [Candidatus Electrothrix sp. AR3]